MLHARCLFVFAAVASMATGCASSTVGLKPQDVAHLKAVAEIPAVHGQPAALRVIGPGKTLAGPMFGIVGALIVEGLAVSDGKDLIKTYGLDDPALRVKERLVAALAERLALNNVRAVATPVEDIDAKTLSGRFKDAVVLAVQTDEWTLRHLDISPYYGIAYGATARLVKTTDGTILSNASCRLGGKNFARLTMDELKADNGAQLKSRIEQTADLCVEGLLFELVSRETVNAATSK